MIRLLHMKIVESLRSMLNEKLWVTCVFPAAPASSQHAGRPVQADADLHEREAERRGPPVRRQRAAGILGALQPPGSL